MRIAELRVKIRSLAAEAGIIRHEERRALQKKDTSTYGSLRDHRRGVVRSAAREALLAYAFLLGVPYAKLEPPQSSDPPLVEARRTAARFGGPDFSEAAWLDWEAAAKAHRIGPQRMIANG